MRTAIGLLVIALSAGAVLRPTAAFAADDANHLGDVGRALFAAPFTPSSGPVDRTWSRSPLLQIGPSLDDGARSQFHTAHSAFSLNLAPAADSPYRFVGDHYVAAQQVDEHEGGRPVNFTFIANQRPAQADLGRWFLFAETSGERVGMGLSRPGRGLAPRSGLTVEDGVAATAIADSQAGLGWRRGTMQASFGYVHREIRNAAELAASHPMADIKGDMLALSFTLSP